MVGGGGGGGEGRGMNAEENNWGEGGGGLMCKCLINSENLGGKTLQRREGVTAPPCNPESTYNSI